MWLDDYREAMDYVAKYFGKDCCWYKIVCSWDGGAFIFTPDPDDWTIVYFRKSHRIEKHFKDTWRNREHKEIIYKGDVE